MCVCMSMHVYMSICGGGWLEGGGEGAQHQTEFHYFSLLLTELVMPSHLRDTHLCTILILFTQTDRGTANV